MIMFLAGYQVLCYFFIMINHIPSIIQKKRDGNDLSQNEIQTLIKEYTRGTLPDYQMSALLMTVFFNGLNSNELVWWADAMLHSGMIMDHTNVSGIKVDKHSTGGVGDKISICLAPAVAACGVPVPMISGRGLGHTGGTLDKLEAIPGFNVNLSPEKSNKMLADLGIFLIGQTLDIAPADKKMYALRDVTGTVESIPLIASSIMSKKLAEGIDALVLDVKFGSGAFMKNFKDAKKLALTLIDIGKSAGKSVHAILTDMNNPIGAAVGNALETKEAIQVMQGTGPSDTVDLTKELGAHMLVLGKKSNSLEDGRQKIGEVLKNGKALELFSKVVERQGGDSEICFNIDLLPSSKYKNEITANQSGYIHQIDPIKIAMSALAVKAGRAKKDDKIDFSTGVELIKQIGDYVKAGDTVALLHHNKNGQTEAKKLITTAIVINSDQPLKIKKNRIKERIYG